MDLTLAAGGLVNHVMSMSMLKVLFQRGIINADQVNEIFDHALSMLEKNQPKAEYLRAAHELARDQIAEALAGFSKPLTVSPQATHTP